MSRNTVIAAAFNNARWCDAVCRTHGHPGELTDALWLNRAQVPPFYPNVVTLTPEGQTRQLEAISALELPGRWGVKDSFAALDLAPLGFEELFSAQWLHYSPERMAPTRTGGARWVEIRDMAALTAWEAAWRGQPSPSHAVFRPGLLEDLDVKILAAYHEDTLVAGAIAYRADGVVSLSNTFFAESRAEVLRAELLGQLLAAFPGLPLVGYEHGDELAAWCALGFEPIGPLRVWLKKT
ncbi:MAG TPA: hypothetical protein VFZ09_32870 [Archangium sp.]|uniref:hypothetical protein n=1 Tax=Archangium sp. TaxID=1872627 RepID=UPI002E3819DA|nr:hypothetical protein [Archangium sp.]HEX5751066.1 hypothetical protein [Archangium sp.]